jgi:hypothetical protein
MVSVGSRRSGKAGRKIAVGTICSEDPVVPNETMVELRVYGRSTAAAFSMPVDHVMGARWSKFGLATAPATSHDIWERRERCGRMVTEVEHIFQTATPLRILRIRHWKNSTLRQSSWSSTKFASDNLPRLYFPQPLYPPWTEPAGRFESTDTMDKKDEDVVAVKVDRTQVFQEARVFNVSPM